MLGGPPGAAQAADALAPGGYTYNISGHTSAPPAGPMRGHYPAGAPCPREVVANWIGPWPGIWLDHTAAFVGAQSAAFFAEYKARGGRLDEIILDTEIGGFASYSVSDNIPRSRNGSEVCVRARWAAIQADTRFPPILAELRTRGFLIGPAASDPDALFKAMEALPWATPPAPSNSPPTSVGFGTDNDLIWNGDSYTRS